MTDDFNRDPAESDEFFSELADMIDLVDTMTRERLSNGELDRRREDIMDRVRRRKAAAPEDDTTPADTTPAPPTTGTPSISKDIPKGQAQTAEERRPLEQRFSPRETLEEVRAATQTAQADAEHYATQSAGGIFINYRTSDAPLEAVLLDQQLTARFGVHAVFRDNRSIDPSTSFEPALWSRLSRSEIVLAVIGPHWLSTSRDGQRLIDRPDDFVRREIAEALRLGIAVVPVLIGDARLPAAADLPSDVRELAHRQFFQIRARNPQPDIDQLLEQLATRLNAAAWPEPEPNSGPAAKPADQITITGNLRPAAIFGHQTNNFQGGE